MEAQTEANGTFCGPRYGTAAGYRSLSPGARRGPGIQRRRLFMKRFARARRTPWLVVVVGVAVFVAAAAVAVAGLQPANLSYTPNSEAQFTNIDVARAWAKNF